MTLKTTFRLALAAAAALALAACDRPDATMGQDPGTSSDAKQVTWTDGKPAYDLNCANPGGCQRRAQAICKGGNYQILKSENMPVAAGIEVYNVGRALATIRCA